MHVMCESAKGTMSRGEPTHAVHRTAGQPLLSTSSSQSGVSPLCCNLAPNLPPALRTASSTVPSYSFAPGVKCTDASELIAVMSGRQITIIVLWQHEHDQ